MFDDLDPSEVLAIRNGQEEEMAWTWLYLVGSVGFYSECLVSENVWTVSEFGGVSWQ